MVAGDAELRALFRELGSPNAVALYVAARRRGLQVTREQARQMTIRAGERQIFSAPQPSLGRSAVEDQRSRFQVDLLDFRNTADVEGEETSKAVLVLVNAFTREIWARDLPNKTPASTSAAMLSILRTMAPGDEPVVLTADGGGEFQGAFAAMLEKEGIAFRLKDGRNTLASADRSIASLKITLARMMATREGTWKKLLQQAVEALNNTPKSVLHNEAPAQVEENDEVQFMLLQESARNFEHNKKVLARRTKDLKDAGSFRAPLEGLERKTFKRGNDASYGAVKRLESIEGSTAIATDGSRSDVKHLRAVQEESTEVTARLGDQSETQTTMKKRRDAETLRAMSVAYLTGKERDSIQKLATHLKTRLRAATLTFQQNLDKIKLRNLAAVLRLFPALFELEGQWVKLVE
jgi:hypothetical protein